MTDDTVTTGRCHGHGETDEDGEPPSRPEVLLYSNTGYTLAAEIIYKISGKTLAEFAQREYLQASRDEAYEISPRGTARSFGTRAYGYRGISEPYEEAPFEMRMPRYDVTGPTNLVTTVGDLIRWQNNFDTKTVGGATAIADMLNTATLSSGTPVSLRTGAVCWEATEGSPSSSTTAATPGSRSHLIRFPDQRFAVAFLCNHVAAGRKPAGQVRARDRRLYLTFPDRRLRDPLLQPFRQHLPGLRRYRRSPDRVCRELP